MQKKKQDVYANSPEARDFLKRYPEFSKDITNSHVFEIPKDKDLTWMNHIDLLRGKARDVLLDVSAGLSNDEILRKYNFKNKLSLEVYIAKSKTWILNKLKERKKSKHRNRKSITSLKDYVTSKTFTYDGVDKTVYLVNAGKDYILYLDDFTPENAEALFNRGELVEDIMPPRIYSYWLRLKENERPIDYLFENKTLREFLGRFRWVDENGVTFKAEVDVLISVTDDLPQALE